MMEKDIQRLLEKSAEQFRAAGFGHIELADTLLSLLFWKYLTDNSSNRSRHPAQTQWVAPPEEFGFDQVISRRHNRDLIYDYERAAVQWENLNHELRGLLAIARLKSIPADVWENVCMLWFNFFKQDGYRIGDIKEDQLNVLDHIEALLAGNYAEAHIFFTPRDVASLMVDLLGDMNDKSVYDPYCRSGDMLALAARKYRHIKQIEGNAQENITWKIARIQLVMIDAAEERTIHKDSLNRLHDNSSRYDIILTNPPFGPVNNRDILIYPTSEWGSRFYNINRIDVRFLCHVLDKLNENGRAAVIVPGIILSGKGMLQALREKLVKDNVLEGVITLPKVFYRTGVSAAILLLNAGKPSRTVTLIDASTMGVKKGDRTELREIEVNEIVRQFWPKNNITDQGSNITANCITITSENIEEHDFDLQFSCYKSSNTTFFQNLTSSKRLLKECEELERQLTESQHRIKILIERNSAKDIPGGS